MALHRDIFWVGKQWAVTGSGMQAVDQKRKGKFDIEISRLWEDGLLESMQSLNWLNIEDFGKALAMARARFPAPSGKAAPPAADVSRRERDEAVAQPKSVDPTFEMRIEGWPAKFVRPWRIRMGR